MRALPLSAADVAPYLELDPLRYTWRLLRLTEHYEAWVIAWLSGQRTTIHNHGKSAVGFKVLSGVATELTFERSAGGFLYPVSSARYEAGSVASGHDDLVHQVCNLEAPGTPLIGIHLYSPPLQDATTFTLSDTPFGRYDELCDTIARHRQPPRSEEALLPPCF